MKLFNTNHTIMEQLTAMLEGMTTRYMSGEERADKEKLAGHVATMRPREVDGLWLELKEAANAPREMQERIKKLEEALAMMTNHAALFNRDTDESWVAIRDHARALLTTPSTIN